MKRRLEDAVIDILSFSPAPYGSPLDLTGYSSAQWDRCLAWMDDVGLALYFLNAIEPASHVVPAFVMQSLRQKHCANQARTAYMQHRFKMINRRFESAGIRYAAVKGLTLVPRFCPDASLRHQSDFDYLTDQESLFSASRLLQDIGYILHIESDRERVFIYPDHRKPERGGAQYHASAPHSVELHLTIGHFPHLAWKEPPFLGNAVVRELDGSAFCGLSDEDSFLLQAVHAFHHLLDGWMKLSWLYEIGRFLHSAADQNFGKRASVSLVADPLLREAVAVIVNLSSQLFRARIPAEFAGWIKEIRPAVLVWMETYARSWALGRNRIDEFDLFPTNKLVLFLHRQYVPDPEDWRTIATQRLLALKGIKRVSRAVTTKLSSERKTRTRLSMREFRRIVFHLGSGIRYMWEMPRWWHLTRACPPGKGFEQRSSQAA